MVATMGLDSWTSEELASAISALGPEFEEVSQTFADRQITGKFLYGASPQVLYVKLKGDLGVKAFDVRTKLLGQIDKWKTDTQENGDEQGDGLGSGQESTLATDVREAKPPDLSAKRAREDPIPNPGPTAKSTESPSPVLVSSSTTSLPGSPPKKRRITPKLIGPVRTRIHTFASTTQLSDFTQRKEEALNQGVAGPVGYRNESEFADGDLVVEGEDKAQVELEEEVEEMMKMEELGESGKGKGKGRAVSEGEYGTMEDQTADIRDEEERAEDGGEEGDGEEGDGSIEEESGSDGEEKGNSGDDGGDGGSGGVPTADVANQGSSSAGQNVINLDSDDEEYYIARGAPD
ncbi:uncharacterized protein EV422DRAFT_528036 [Fimicolochytrium jonesii]|uniref:uncharacterized protein n=1 Tax=Fimicolochytrium jonesii TaxID=1396493 RepID=UPI0022FDBD77|nr:uncharacterized protein EV422DRAFT_528036 [Fimicolochytrium jonesii]KAI8821403.1 hypothetical protein EV422DRAFT_528036 [Fimicolochytrium jonesii]